MGLINWVAHNRLFKMIFMFDPERETDDGETKIYWHESGIKRYLIFWIVAMLVVLYFFTGIPSLRIYTMVVVLITTLYFKLAEIMPQILDDIEEFEIEFEPGLEESGFYQTIEKQMKSDDGLTFGD